MTLTLQDRTELATQLTDRLRRVFDRTPIEVTNDTIYGPTIAVFVRTPSTPPGHCAMMVQPTNDGTWLVSPMDRYPEDSTHERGDEAVAARIAELTGLA